MVVWRRAVPEWIPGPPGRWKTLPAHLTEADQREFGIERADEDEAEKVRLLQAYAPVWCLQCEHPNAPQARKEIVKIIRAIRCREPLPQSPLPKTCCQSAEAEAAARFKQAIQAEAPTQ
jgi:hypothetical protein